MTPNVRTVGTLNWLRRTTHVNHQKSIEACREPNKAINDAKTNNWKEVLEDTIKNNNGQDMQKVIHLRQTPNQATMHNGHTIIDAKAMAKIFVNHYSKINDPTMSIKDPNVIREFKKGINSLSTWICHQQNRTKRFCWPRVNHINVSKSSWSSCSWKTPWHL